MKALEKFYLLWNLSKNTLNYFLVKDYKFTIFYLLWKIQKWLHDMSGRPVSLNYGYYTENIASYLDDHFEITYSEYQIAHQGSSSS